MNSLSVSHAGHAASFRTPFYSGEQNTVLHRYFSPDFVQKFQRDAQHQQLSSPTSQAWKTEDRFSDHDDRPVLRLPVHKSFYLVSCEIACNQLGNPALDPQKITSSGFVIRRLDAGTTYSWMIEDDEPLGWEESPTGLRDPDVHRRLCRDGSLRPRDPVPTYTGEQTHPLRPHKVVDEQGKCHTLLFGYVPLGGSYIPREDSSGSLFDSESLLTFSTTISQQLPWPYGHRPSSSAKRWLKRYEKPIDEGRPSKQFFELLRVLLNRYHLGEANIESNTALQELTEGIYFYDELRVSSFFKHRKNKRFNDFTRNDFLRARKYSLWSWLRYHFSQQENDLVAWVTRQEEIIDDAGGIDGSFSFEKLPSKSSNQLSRYSLYQTSGDAQDFRTHLNQRALDHALEAANAIPLPKFQQGKDDIYQIVPFVRVLNDDQKEHTIWADGNTYSEEFRVAAPFDPDASRPSLIQMPSLGDLKKGLAKGVGIITPPDTFNLINALNLKKGASEDVIGSPDSGGIGVQWICSFSLPVITLVAMILLMIMISLLNIVFFWLPWVKICLPFPKMK